MPKIIRLFNDVTGNSIPNVRRAATATKVSIECVQVSLEQFGQLSKAQFIIIHQSNVCVYTVILHWNIKTFTLVIINAQYE